GADFEACVREAATKFLQLFRDGILQLVRIFPENYISSSGQPFWTDTRQFPRAAPLDCARENKYLNFVISAAKILAVSCGVVPPPEKFPLPKDHIQHSRNVPELEPTAKKFTL
ncbi:unnamed protein product, partial [Choristocarpus tenellus]